MPAPQPLQSTRVQFISGAAFTAAAIIFFLSKVISRVELDALYRTTMFLSIIHHAAALIQQLPVPLNVRWLLLIVSRNFLLTPLYLKKSPPRTTFLLFFFQFSFG